MSLILLPVLETLFFLLACLLQLWGEGFCLISLQFVLWCLVVVSWRPVPFWEETEGQRIGVERRYEETWRSEVKRKCGWDALHERRIYFHFFLKKKKVSSYGVNAGSSTYKYKMQTYCVLESKHIFWTLKLIFKSFFSFRVAPLKFYVREEVLFPFISILYKF